MEIIQWENKNLSHFSYGVKCENEMKMVLIDPARNAQRYLNYAAENKVEIVGIIETHPHADFISSHLELHEKTGAKIYASKLTEALYPFEPWDEECCITMGQIKLLPIITPGHSPDSICILLLHNGLSRALFTGDTLFIGDCGRPDLREEKGGEKFARTRLAQQMYHSLRQKVMPLPDNLLVYPAHGAGTLCGKSLSDAKSSTLGQEKSSNWSLQSLSETDFVQKLLEDQPFVPAYFQYDVALNKKGAPILTDSLNKVKIRYVKVQSDVQHLKKDVWIIDTRDEKSYKKNHLHYSSNLQAEAKFETWLGSLIYPNENYYLAAGNLRDLQSVIERSAAIGYETKIEEALVLEYFDEKMDELDLTIFKNAINSYTIVDVRNDSEILEGKIFPSSLSMPLNELRNKVSELPINKPIVVHCASGFRSAAGSSLLQSELENKVQVLDLGEMVKLFIKE
ncbi:MAG: rhodanese-like domain-containing protein [Flavisolibacter sp.]